jgi:hypothetical protein
MEAMHRRQRAVNSLPLHTSHPAIPSRFAPAWNPVRLYPERGFLVCRDGMMWLSPGDGHSETVPLLQAALPGH